MECDSVWPLGTHAGSMAAYAMCSLLDWPHNGPHSSADGEEWIRMENLVHALSKVVAHCQAVGARAEPKSCERL